MDNFKNAAAEDSLSDVSSTMTSLDAGVVSVTEKFNQVFQDNKRTFTKADDHAQDYVGAFRIINETLRQIVEKQSRAVNMLMDINSAEDNSINLLDILGEKIRDKIKERDKKKAEEEKKAKDEEEKKLKDEEEKRKKDEEDRKKNADEEKKANDERAEKLKNENKKAADEREKAAKDKLNRQNKASDNKEARETERVKAAEDVEKLKRQNDNLSKKEARESTQAERVAKDNAPKAEVQAEKVGEVTDDSGRFRYNPKLDRWVDQYKGRGGGHIISDATAADLGLEDRGSIKKRIAAGEDVNMHGTRAAPPPPAETPAPAITPEFRRPPSALDRYAPKVVGVAGKVLSAYVAYELIKDTLTAILQIIALYVITTTAGPGRNAVVGGAKKRKTQQVEMDPKVRRDRIIAILAPLAREYGLAALGMAVAVIFDSAIGALVGAVAGAGVGSIAGLIAGLLAAITTMEIVDHFASVEEMVDWIDIQTRKVLGSIGLGAQGDAEAIEKYNNNIKSKLQEIQGLKKETFVPADPLEGPNGENYRYFRQGGISDGPETGYTATLHGKELIIPLEADGSLSLRSLEFNARNIEFNARSYIFDTGNDKVNAPTGGSTGGSSSGSTGGGSAFGRIQASINNGNDMTPQSSISPGTTPSSGGGGVTPIDPNVKSTPFSGSQGDFYSKIYNSILTAAKAKGLPNPEVIAQLGASQSSVETGYGQHMVGNNAFGIKGQGTAGTINAMTSEVIGGQSTRMSQGFAAYNSVEESAVGYVDFISNNPRYRNVLSATSVGDAAMAIAAAGYATDPNYAQKIYNVANKSGTLMSTAQGNGVVMNKAAAVDAAYKAGQESKATEKSAGVTLGEVSANENTPDVSIIGRDISHVDRLDGLVST